MFGPVEATQYRGKPKKDFADYVVDGTMCYLADGTLAVKTSWGWNNARKGDWIVREPGDRRVVVISKESFEHGYGRR